MGELKGIFIPEGGWENNTWYLLEVKMKYSNPLHLHMYFTGYNNEGYSGGFPVGYAPNEISKLQDYYYVRVIKKIDLT